MSTATSTAATEKATPIYTSGVAFRSSVVKVNLVAIAIKAILVVHGLLSYLVPRNHLTGGGGGVTTKVYFLQNILLPVIGRAIKFFSSHSTHRICILN